MNKKIDINNLPKGWKVEEGRKSRITGKKRLYIINPAGKCVIASCGKCGAVLDVENFNANKKNGYGIRTECKTCQHEDNKRWRENTPEYYQGWKEGNKKWRENNSEKLKESYKKWYEENFEKRKEYIKKWNENNPEKRKAIKSRRRARTHGNGGSYTAEQLQECINFFNGCCAYTGEVLAKEYHIDHIKPLANGGTNFIHNLVPATPKANLSKGAKDLEEWYKQQEYYCPERLNKIYQWQESAFELYGEGEV